MEMLIVVAVIAILTAIALPTFRNTRERANQEADIQAVSALYTEMQSEYEIYGKTNTRSVEEPMQADYDSSNPRAGEISDLNPSWKKGDIVTITFEGVDDNNKPVFELN